MSKTLYYSPKLRVAKDFINEYVGDHDMRLERGGGVREMPVTLTQSCGKNDFTPIILYQWYARNDSQLQSDVSDHDRSGDISTGNFTVTIRRYQR